MSNVGKFMGFGTAVAFIIGAAQYLGHRPLPVWATFVMAALIVAFSALVWGVDTVRRFKRPKPATGPVDPYSSPARYGSRRWSRAMYHNGIISMEELNKFYAGTPDNPADPDN
jgi:hypothetical protein